MYQIIIFMFFNSNKKEEIINYKLIFGNANKKEERKKMNFFVF